MITILGMLPIHTETRRLKWSRPIHSKDREAMQGIMTTNDNHMPIGNAQDPSKKGEVTKK